MATTLSSSNTAAVLAHLATPSYEYEGKTRGRGGGELQQRLPFC